MKKISWFFGIAILFFLGGCTTANITSTWSPNDSVAVQHARYKKIFVVGIFQPSGRTLRAQVESQIVSDLQNYRFNAYSSYETSGPKSFQNMTENEALKTIPDSAADAIVTVQVVDQSKQKTFQPSYPYGYGYGYNPYYYGGYGYPFNRQIGYYRITTNLLFETNVYDVKTKKLIYSSQTQSADASSLEMIAKDFSKTVIKDLRKNNVLG